MKVPAAVGVPLIVTTLAAQLPVTPGGKPLKFAPVALTVAYVIVVIGVLIQTAWLLVPVADVSVIEHTTTLMVPVALTTPQPPVSVTV